jgi:N-acyl-D-amino-acid deacylase
MAASYDVVIRNGLVYDGTGAAPVRADLGLRGDRIAALGAVDGEGALEIDAEGLAVAPGFIDVHTHDDFAAILHPDMSFKLLGGVTSCVGGNCGMGAAPHQAATLMAQALHPNSTLPEWEGYAGYLDYLEAHPPSVNLGVLVGHTTLRVAVMGGETREPTEDELEAMKGLLREGLEAGALGLSSGLIYDPGRQAKTDELVALARELRGFGGLYTTHVRDEGAGLLESFAEAIEVGERADVPVQISHHKATGRDNWGKVTESLRLIEDAQQRGLDVHADQYPYTAGSTILSAIAEMARLGATEGGGSGGMGAEDVVIASTASHPEWEGRSMADLAKEFGVSALEAGARILKEEPSATAILHSMSEEDVQTVMRHPSTMIGSDGIPTLGGKPHPRLYGSFARVLGHYARDLGLFPFEEAIHKMTGLSAKKFGFSDRGVVREGACADLVVFDPDTIRDVGTFEDPNHYPTGICHVFVNGQQAVRDGQHTGARSGRALRRKGGVVA